MGGCRGKYREVGVSVVHKGKKLSPSFQEPRTSREADCHELSSSKVWIKLRLLSIISTSV